ncbi:hypothetical protein MX629_00665 [Carnobacterium divergens]|uniref:Lipoprotein n=1 Tax=Carnobacterium divergens TaxID=2748 RepID=A0AAW8RBH4_CARDV|nr:hypothetical protein [Carnobacterium divergens]MDT1956931.1 hypothetical protein [Carnobacterium divergens]MDT1972901.1 hypothetical protein [Carnobacterium divergens]
MKKTMTILLISMSVLLAGCNKNEESAVIDPEVKKEQASSTEQPPQQEEYDLEFAEVTDIVGNEVSLKFGTPPEEEPVEEQTGGGDEAAVNTEAQSISDLVSELEFTGEQLKVTIETGTEILSGGKASSLSSLKKGSVIALERDKDNHIIQINIIM